MAQKNEVYKCSICGNIVEVLHSGTGSMTCCNQPMMLLTENTVDASKEKHVPIIKKSKTKIKIKVGSIPHPMEEAHYIEFIEVILDGISYKKFLKPGEKPEAEFPIKDAPGTIIVREFCNLHGLWKA